MDVLAIEASARKPRSICRNLFGTPPPPSSSSVDPTQNIRLLQQLNEQVMETCSQRWNFDFRKCVPMDGRYEWRRPADDFNDRRRTTSSASCAAVQTEPVAMTTTTITSLPVVTSSTNFRRKRQATITDYFPCKKHMRTHSFHSTDDGAK